MPRADNAPLVRSRPARPFAEASSECPTIQTEGHADQRVEPLPLKLATLALADRSVQIDGPAQKVSNSRWYGYALAIGRAIRLSSTRTTLMTPLGSTNMAPRTATR